ncbi:MAG TPA: hypothetical protein VLM37_01350 [Fibrobacteraceae bacterium]|nr:hypothetical protein [Fibrobacteraceae bacterium]
MRNLIFIGLAFCVSSALAEHAEVHYFVQVGSSVEFPAGDINGKTTVSLDSTLDSSLVPETVGVPNLPVFPVARLRLGSYIDASSISLGFGYGRPLLEEFPNAVDAPTQHANWWELDVEYQYNWLWPGPFRPSFGINYGFWRMQTQDASISAHKHPGDVLFSGYAMGLVIGFGWYGIPHFCVRGDLRGRLVSINNLATDVNDLSELSDPVRDWITGLSLSVQYVF